MDILDYYIQSHSQEQLANIEASLMAPSENSGSSNITDKSVIGRAVAIHGDQLVGHGVDTPSALNSDQSVSALKELIHYKEYSGTCGTCKHMVEKDHPYTDRQWIMTCTWSNTSSYHFVTASHHTCNMWKPK